METNPHSPLKSHSFVRKSRRQRQRFPRIVTETSNSSRIIDWFGWGLSIVALTDGRTGGFDWVSFWNTQHLLTNWRRGRITIHYHFFCFCFFKMKSVKERIWNDRFFSRPSSKWNIFTCFVVIIVIGNNHDLKSRINDVLFSFRLFLTCFLLSELFSLSQGVFCRFSQWWLADLTLSLFLSNQQPELGAPSIVVIFSVFVTTTLQTTYYYYHDRHQYGSFVRQLLVL